MLIINFLDSINIIWSNPYILTYNLVTIFLAAMLIQAPFQNQCLFFLFVLTLFHRGSNSSPLKIILSLFCILLFKIGHAPYCLAKKKKKKNGYHAFMKLCNYCSKSSFKHYNRLTFSYKSLEALKTQQSLFIILILNETWWENHIVIYFKKCY